MGSAWILAIKPFLTSITVKGAFVWAVAASCFWGRRVGGLMGWMGWVGWCGVGGERDKTYLDSRRAAVDVVVVEQQEACVCMGG